MTQLRPGCRCALWVALACAAGYALCAALLISGDTQNRELMRADDEYAAAFMVRVVVGGVLLVAMTTVTAYLAATRTIGPAATALQRQEALLADTAHDLRTPVAALRALAETAVANPHRQTELLLRTVDLSRRMGTIIDDVLIRARLAAGVEALVTEPVWLDQLVAVVVEETPVDGAEVSIVTEPTMVAADPALLQRAVGNLLDNALRHGRLDGRPAIVQVTVADGRVTVADRGPGIDPALSAGMFDRFAGCGGSSGLGLSIVRWVVEAHDGSFVEPLGAAYMLALHAAGRTAEALDFFARTRGRLRRTSLAGSPPARASSAARRSRSSSASAAMVKDGLVAARTATTASASGRPAQLARPWPSTAGWATATRSPKPCSTRARPGGRPATCTGPGSPGARP